MDESTSDQSTKFQYSASELVLDIIQRYSGNVLISCIKDSEVYSTEDT